MAATGEVLAGRYRVGGVLGRGGMAEVRRAEDLGSGEPVAVKLLRGIDADALRRLGAERETMARLGHPGLVGLRDAGVHRGEPFLVLDLVDGVDLASLLRQGPLGAERAAELLAPVASGLAHAHAAGVVHRDVKPSNILVAGDGLGRLADFGIARLADATRLTATGLVVGTAVYLAPEQLRGERAGPAADVYALGLVLFECVTGERAFTGTSVESAMARLVRRPGVPAAVPVWCRVLLRAMTDPDPGSRPSAANVAAELASRVETAGVGAADVAVTEHPAADVAATERLAPEVAGSEHLAAEVAATEQLAPARAAAVPLTTPAAADAPTAVAPTAGASTPLAGRIAPPRRRLSSRAFVLLVVGVSLLVAAAGVAVGRERARRDQPDVPSTAPATPAATSPTTAPSPSSSATTAPAATSSGPAHGSRQDSPATSAPPPAPARGKQKGHAPKGDR